ncbi:hypothetical protein AB9K41_14170 [Cribrihabitans sp. XS_ASV171]
MQPVDKHPTAPRFQAPDMPFYRKVIRVFESCSEMQRRVNRFHDV